MNYEKGFLAMRSDGKKPAGTLLKRLISRARDIIEDPASWTQSTSARDHLQQSTSPRSEEARAFCAFGALTKAAHEQGFSDSWLADLFDASLLSELIRANDSQDHAAVVKLLELLERQIE